MNGRARQGHGREDNDDADQHHPLGSEFLVQLGIDEHAARGADGQDAQVSAALRHLRWDGSVLVKLDDRHRNQRDQRHKNVREEA